MTEASIKLADAEPYPGSPRCFKRLWNPTPNPAPWVVQIEGPILIYGYSCRSTFAEDARVEARAWLRHRTFNAICFSKEFPDPEMGFVPMAEIVEVPESELRAVADAWGVVV